MAAAVAIAAGTPGGAARLAAQQPLAPARATVALAPDTARVGEPVTLGLRLVVRADVEPRPPRRLPGLPEALEQIEAPAVRRESDPPGPGLAAWRLSVPLRAWRAGEWELPPPAWSIPVLLGDVVGAAGPRAESGDGPAAAGSGPGADRIAPRVLVVRSVLPPERAGEPGPDPAPPRPPPGDSPRLGWLLLLAALLAALLVWRALRRRAAVPAPAEPPDPLLQARRQIGALRAAVATGRLDPIGFYDALQPVLRRSIGHSRGWPPGRPLRRLSAPDDAGMVEVQRRSAAARFAGRPVDRTAALEDAGRAIRWLEGEAENVPDDSATAGASPAPRSPREDRS